MSKEIMTEEAFYELIENLEVVDKLTIYGKNAIKYWVLKLQKENKLAKEQLKKQCEIADERNDLLVKVQKLQKENKECKILYQKALSDVVSADKENIELKKQIDLIIEEYEFYDRINFKNFCEDQLRKNICIQDCKNCAKQYFENKAKGENINE